MMASVEERTKDTWNLNIANVVAAYGSDKAEAHESTATAASR
jgi:hypothetical protein